MEIDKTAVPPIDELIGFLNKYDNTQIALLKQKFPNHFKLFSEGVILGEEYNDELEVRAESCRIALDSIVKKCDEVIPLLKEKMKQLNVIQLFSQIIVAIGGASIFGLIQNDGFYVVKYIAASFVLIGSIINIYFQFVSNSLLPDSNSFFKDYNGVIDCSINSQKCLFEITTLLKITQKTKEDKKELRMQIGKGNELAYELKKHLIKIL